jgi:hypothetical protein
VTAAAQGGTVREGSAASTCTPKAIAGVAPKRPLVRTALAAAFCSRWRSKPAVPFLTSSPDSAIADVNSSKAIMPSPSASSKRHTSCTRSAGSSGIHSETSPDISSYLP